MNNVTSLIFNTASARTVSDASISVQNVTVAYRNGHVALSDASFELGASTICGLVGVNGSGKSTLFKTIMGFARPAGGEVLVCGMAVGAELQKDPSTLPPEEQERRRKILYNQRARPAPAS